MGGTLARVYGWSPRKRVVGLVDPSELHFAPMCAM